MRDEKKRLDHLKQDQTMLVIKRFRERKKVFREIKKTKKFRAKRAGLEAVLKGGPWMIRNSPIILKKWAVNTSLQKEETTPKFKESITIGIPDIEGYSFIMETIRVEYEWKPPRCHTCNIFGHTGESCPKKVVNTPVVNNTNSTDTPNDGFQKVVNKKRNNKKSIVGNTLPRGVPVAKGFQVGKQFKYQPKALYYDSNGGGTYGATSYKVGSSSYSNKGASVAKKVTSFDKTKDKDVVDTGVMKFFDISSPNLFTVLSKVEDEDDDIENVYDEYVNLNPNHNPGSLMWMFLWFMILVKRFVAGGNGLLMGVFVIKVLRNLGWNDDLVDVIIMVQTNQNRLWVLLGDFYAAFNIKDHSLGGYELNAAMRDFKECVQAMEVADVNSTGLHFNCNQKPKGSNGILKKIDRIMGNLQFNDDFPGSFAIFQPTEGFREIVESKWNVNIKGYAMFWVVKRLKGLKSPFRKLLHDHGNLHERVNKIRVELNEAQKAIDMDPFSFILRDEHAHYVLDFKEAQLDDERFLKQKAKVEWLKASDSNTAYFHKIAQSKCAKNRIEMVSDSSNTFYDGNQADCMVRNVTDAEIKSVMFSMEDDRAPSLNGFTAAFYKKAWDVVGGDITCAIRDFFSNVILAQFLLFMDALEEFKQVLGLVPSIPKSTTYFCNVPNAMKASILNFMPFAEGVLPVRYLGIPLISSRLLYRDCKILVEKLESKASIFILPYHIVHDLEQFMHGFLWCQGEIKKGKAKVAWDYVCMPKHEGGLGIRRIEDFNIALMATHIWIRGLYGLNGFILISLKVVVFGMCLVELMSDGDGKLKTQDRLRQWDVGSSIDINLLKCPLCDSVPNSHGQLFFECSFSSQVWAKTTVSILFKIVVAATSYYIWLERNRRLFKKKTSSPDQIVDVILSTVRLKLVTFKFKKMSTKSHFLLDQWKIPSYCIVHDGSTG
uniref:Reverse transcriptase domain, reverse transcriptase zinc-binding domain protein n=1 Tax=Tanacetum cinerariifolium TaxID=118510 RepID=A0A6L2NRZ3_TANCI|nr:hypothetical protein [Tanacetum cinerariifolium]